MGMTDMNARAAVVSPGDTAPLLDHAKDTLDPVTLALEVLVI